MAKKGKSMVSTDITTADISSMMETNILPIPPVTIVLVPRTVAVVNCAIEAVPPPPIIEILHVKKGSNSPIKEAVKIVPATTAAGVASIFNTLSINGRRYAHISNTVATENAIRAGVDPIHSKFVAKVTQDTFAAILVIKSGVKIRNPAEALKPIPINIASNNSK